MQQRRRPGYQYWFPARKNGWGWRLPATWQGWLIVDIYLGCFIIFLFIALFGGGMYGLLGILGAVAVTAALIWVCYKKGEPQRVRRLGK